MMLRYILLGSLVGTSGRHFTTATTNLSIGAVSFATFATLEKACFGATRGAHLSVPDGLLHKLLTHLLHRITSHLLLRVNSQVTV